MPRKKRIWYPDATYHVMSRGNRRTAIFQNYIDYVDFLECFLQIKEMYSFKVHAICLMTNHFHVCLQTVDTELWRIMQKVLSVYAEGFNHRYNYSGHLFEGRYTAQIIEDEQYFLEVSRYIHLNPVKARMVLSPLDYEYSSYGKYVNYGSEEQSGKERTRCRQLISELTDTSRVLGCFRNNNNEQYRMFVEGKISHVGQELLIQKDMNENEMWLPW